MILENHDAEALPQNGVGRVSCGRLQLRKLLFVPNILLIPDDDVLARLDHRALRSQLTVALEKLCTAPN